MTKAINLLSKILLLLHPSSRFVQQSYSQEGEDRILKALYEDQPDYKGFYVDIGAHHPFRFSNTYLFCRSGWKGINIDPMPDSMKLFNRFRPNDLNLEVGVASTTGNMDFYCFNEPALNTFDAEAALARDPRDGYHIVRKISVEVIRLDSLLDRHLPQGISIDFITIDAEGFDYDILTSNNWNKYRPRFVLVESATKEDENDRITDYLTEKLYNKVARTPRTVFFKDATYPADKNVNR